MVDPLSGDVLVLYESLFEDQVFIDLNNSETLFFAVTEMGKGSVFKLTSVLP